jgi:hypothetical protein
MQTINYLDFNKLMGSWFVLNILPKFHENNDVNNIITDNRIQDFQVKNEYKYNKSGSNRYEKN